MGMGRLDARELLQGLRRGGADDGGVRDARPDLALSHLGAGQRPGAVAAKRSSSRHRRGGSFTGYVPEAEKVTLPLDDCFLMAGWGEGGIRADRAMLACGITTSTPLSTPHRSRGDGKKSGSLSNPRDRAGSCCYCREQRAWRRPKASRRASTLLDASFERPHPLMS